MATSISAKHLECSVCLDAYENPKELVCRHLYCKSCLDSLLEFNVVDGSAVIKCPLRCSKTTSITKNETTNDLPTNFFAKGIIEEIDVNNKNLDNHLGKCQYTSNCENNVSKYCCVCSCMMCKTCTLLHNKNNANHKIKSIAFSPKDMELRVVCDQHQTYCDYMCCDNEVVCLYCVKRTHHGHRSDTLVNQVANIKQALQSEIKKMESVEEITRISENCISSCQKLFDQTLTTRKQICLSKYIQFLKEEEDTLKVQFSLILADYVERYPDISEPITYYTDTLDKHEIELVLQKQIMLDTIYEFNTYRMSLPVGTVSLSDFGFRGKSPLGELKCVFDDNLPITADLPQTPTFKSEITPPVIGEDALKLLHNLKKLLEEEVKLTDDFITNSLSATGECSSEPKEFVKPKILLKSKGRKRTIKGRYDTETDEGKRMVNHCLERLCKEGMKYIEQLIHDGDGQIFRLILSAIPDIMEMKDNEGNTPFIIAAYCDKLHIMEELVLHDCKTDATNKYGLSALHRASLNNSFECVTWLCQQYPQLINAKDKSDRTPLYYAVFDGSLNTTQILLQNNASILIQDNGGINAVDVAKRFGKHQCLEELKKVLNERGEVDDGKYKDCHTIDDYQRKYAC